MPRQPSRFIAYGVDANEAPHLTMCGIRAPTVPYPQQRRERPEFVAFLVIKGEIHLTDEMPDGIDPVVVGPGEIHVVGPGVWQSSTVPFPPGIVFLWFHFTIGSGTLLTADEADAVVRDQLQPPDGVPLQKRWLIPRQLQLGDELDQFTRDHTDLLENERLWGIHDLGTQALGAALVYRLHRAMTRSRQRGSDFARHAPEVVHAGRAKAWIRLHHERPIALAGIARAIGLNPAYLSRCFRRVTGETVGEALLAARIETAKRLLLDGVSVKAAAHHAGFASASYFCRRFHRATGTTPLGYVAHARRTLKPTRRSPRTSA